MQNAAARWPVVAWFLVYRFAGHFQKVDGGRGKAATVEPMVQAQLTSSSQTPGKNHGGMLEQ